jgi:hypothetical protein
VLAGDAEFGALLERGGFDDPSLPEARRAIVVVDVTRVSDSCGYGVPLMRLEGLRDHHALSVGKSLRAQGEAAYLERQRARHQRSLDGLPGALAD